MNLKLTHYCVLLIIGTLHNYFQFSECLPVKELGIKENTEDILSNEDESKLQKRETNDDSKTPDDTGLNNLPGEINPCNLPRLKGNCKENHTRYYYDDLQKNCIVFQYTGCGFNENNFESLNECENACVLKRTSRKISKANKYKRLNEKNSQPQQTNTAYERFLKRKFPIVFCGLQRDNGVICPGIKRGNYLNQFYYDDEQNRCIQFIYNGCGGNANKFNSIWECVLACGPQQ